MLVEAIDKPMCYRWPEGEVQLLPGHPVDLPESRALRLLQRAPGKVRAVPPPETPAAPLHPGWLVAYRDRRGVLCGGCDDRAHGTVDECRWGGKAWTVILTDGQRLTLPAIRSVGQTDAAGQLVAAWTVKEQGADGQGPIEGNRLHAGE
jgi:hypothetical protein